MKNYLKYILLIVFVFVGFSCEDYLERLPLDQPSSDTFFANENELEMAVTGVYNRLWFWPVGTAWFLSFDFASDDGWDRNNSGLQALGRGEQNSDNGYTNGFWSHFYRAIGRVNFIASNSVNLVDEMGQENYNSLVGEARFLRAYFYAYLAELYGDIPLITSVLALEESETPRVPKSQVSRGRSSTTDTASPRRTRTSCSHASIVGGQRRVAFLGRAWGWRWCRNCWRPMTGGLTCVAS